MYRRSLPIFVWTLAVCGCVSVDSDAKRARESLCSGDGAEAVAWSAELAEESVYSRSLGYVESGRVAMLGGKYGEAARRFRSAVDSAVDRTEASPKLKLGDLANTAMSSTITDDRTREYYLPPYEVNLALEYAILSQILSGKREEAVVDARLAVYVQDTLAGLFGADVAEERKQTDRTASTIIAEQEKALEAMIAATRNSWENPLLWWLTGVLFEADGDADAAWQSYRKAAAIMPECGYFSADAARAGKSVSPQAGKAKLVVVFEDDFVPQRRSLKIPVPVYTGFSIDIPQYADEIAPVRKVTVSGSQSEAAAEAVVDVRSLAARDLKEKLPGIVVRNLTRAAVQAGAQAAVNASGNNYAKVAVFAGNMVVSACRRADTRSWVTLPAMQYVWCDGSMMPGKYEIGVCVGGRTTAVKISLAAGETRILWMSDTGSVVRGASATIGGKGMGITDLNGKEINR